MKPSAATLRKASAALNRYAALVKDSSPSAAREAETLAMKIAPKRRVPKVLPSTQSRENRANKAVLTSMVRRACLERARGRCECGCGMPFLWEPECDHFFGKRFTSIEECWILRRDHHREKTENYPTRQAWDSRFQTHCANYGYKFRSRGVKTLGLRSRGGRPLRSHPATTPTPPGAR